MKKITKAKLMVLALVLVLLLPIAHAALSDSFTRVFLKIDNFFTAQQYKPYAKTIDFIFFTMFFMALYVQVIKHAFKENTKPVKFIAILLGIMSGFLLTAGGYSVQKLIPYIPWLLYFLLAAFFYRLFTAMEWPKSRGWRLFLSLLLAALLLWLLSQWLFPRSAQFGGVFDGFGRIELPDISAPGVTIPSPGSTTGQGNANVAVVTKESGGGFWDGLWGATKAGAGFAGDNWYHVFWLLIPLLLWGGWKGFQKARAGRQAINAAPQLTEEQRWDKLQGAVREVVDEIRQVIAQKEKVWKIIDDLTKGKVKLEDEFLDVYHKMVNDPDYNPANLAGEDTATHQILNQAHEKVGPILSLEIQLMKELVELMKLEESLIGPEGKVSQWKQKLGRIYLSEHFTKGVGQFRNVGVDRALFSLDFIQDLEKNTGEWIAAPPYYKESLVKMSKALKNLDSAQYATPMSERRSGVVHSVMMFIRAYAVLLKKESTFSKDISKLTTSEDVRKWVYGGESHIWQQRMDAEGPALRAIFEEEVKLLGLPWEGTEELSRRLGLEEKGARSNTLRFNLGMQIRYLKWVLQLIAFLESSKKSFTQLQEIWLRVKRGDGFVEVKCERIELQESGGIHVVRTFTLLPTDEFVICTRLAEGNVQDIPPMKARCYKNLEEQPDDIAIPEAEIIVQKKYDLISFTKEQLHDLRLGPNRITVMAFIERESEKKAGWYRRMGRADAIINVSGLTHGPNGAVGIQSLPVWIEYESNGSYKNVQFTYKNKRGIVNFPVCNVKKESKIKMTVRVPKEDVYVEAIIGDGEKKIVERPGKELIEIPIGPLKEEVTLIKITASLMPKTKEGAMTTYGETLFEIRNGIKER